MHGAEVCYSLRMAKNKNRSAADIARVQAVQELRRSNAANPVRNRKRYRRVDAKRIAHAA